jgi:hypothetical protein
MAELPEELLLQEKAKAFPSPWWPPAVAPVHYVFRSLEKEELRVGSLA